MPTQSSTLAWLRRAVLEVDGTDDHADDAEQHGGDECDAGTATERSARRRTCGALVEACCGSAGLTVAPVVGAPSTASMVGWPPDDVFNQRAVPVALLEPTGLVGIPRGVAAAAAAAAPGVGGLGPVSRATSVISTSQSRPTRPLGRRDRRAARRPRERRSRRCPAGAGARRAAPGRCRARPRPAGGHVGRGRSGPDHGTTDRSTGSARGTGSCTTSAAGGGNGRGSGALVPVVGWPPP